MDLKKAKPRDQNSEQQAPPSQSYSQKNQDYSNKSVSKNSRQPKKKNGNKNNKVFIGGIPKELTIEEFTDYFNQYGEIHDIAIICDKKTREPRGFGFVTFTDYSSVKGVLKDYSKHYFLEKWVECKVAFPKNDSDEEEEVHSHKQSHKSRKTNSKQSRNKRGGNQNYNPGVNSRMSYSNSGSNGNTGPYDNSNSSGYNRGGHRQQDNRNARNHPTHPQGVPGWGRGNSYYG